MTAFALVLAPALAPLTKALATKVFLLLPILALGLTLAPALAPDLALVLVVLPPSLVHQTPHRQYPPP